MLLRFTFNCNALPLLGKQRKAKSHKPWIGFTVVNKASVRNNFLNSENLLTCDYFFNYLFPMKRLHIIALALLTAGNLQAQQFGGFPPSVKWKQINTDTARIIFPSAVGSQAQRIAAIIHKMTTLRPTPLGTNVRKINIVLHNNTTLANGYVALAPFRSEFYLVPGSDIFEFGANPWYQELAVHEFRHVQQYSNFNKGLSKAAGVILGEEGQSLFNAMAIPNWFWEGDAIHSETALTSQGRGRTPYFFNGYKALWKEGRQYNWMKLRNGSLKDYVPDHYQLGYLLVNYGYLKYASEFWGKVTSDAAAFKGLIYPFQQAVKRHSGVDYKTFRKQALEYYSHEVSRKRTDILKRETVTNYYFPQFIGNDSLLYLKSSYNSLPAFYLRNKSGEHKLRLKNISWEEWFSYRNGMIAYTSYEANARWSLIDYSSIYVYDIASGKQTQVTGKGKYYTPDISPSGKNIIAVCVNDTTQTFLQLLDLSGNVIKTIRPVDHANFIHPRFTDENSVVVTERLSNATMQMSRIHLETGKRDILIPPTSALIGYPFFYNGSVFFVSSAAGSDGIYALNLSDKKIFHIASGTTGYYYPSAHNDQLTWSSFTSNGLRIQENAASTNAGAHSRQQAWNEVTLPYPVAENTSNILADIPRQFSVSRYKQGSRLLNFHSWRPYYTDPEFTFSLFSDNIMSTFTNELYYRYNENETSHAFGFNSSYGGFFSMINAGLEYTLGRSVQTTTASYDLNQAEASMGFSIPLSFTKGRMYRFLNFGSDFVYNHTSSTRISKDFFDRTLKYFRHYVRWSHYLPQARQHIYPKFGYTMSADLRHLVANNFQGSLNQNAQWLLGAQLFLPSVKNHSIVLTGAYQRVDTMSFIFSNRFSMSRGYDNYYYRTMWRLSGNYHFPIIYPDLGFGNLIFVQRVRGNIFYDYSKVYSGFFHSTAVPVRNLRSTGIEIYFDTKVWNELPVSFGLRVSHLLDDGRNLPRDARGSNWFEFILPVNLIPD